MGYGIPRENVVIDIAWDDAAVQVHNPRVVEQIRRCTGLFFTGGNQRRVAAAFRGRDGGDTPALAAVRVVYERGGVVAGTSADAAVQGVRTLSASGPPIDTLDFGLASRSHHRGAFISHGLGMFRAGLIDEHFTRITGDWPGSRGR